MVQSKAVKKPSTRIHDGRGGSRKSGIKKLDYYQLKRYTSMKGMYNTCLCYAMRFSSPEWYECPKQEVKRIWMLTTNLCHQSFSYQTTERNELCSLLFLLCLLYFYIHAHQFLTHAFVGCLIQTFSPLHLNLNLVLVPLKNFKRLQMTGSDRGSEKWCLNNLIYVRQ